MCFAALTIIIVSVINLMYRKKLMVNSNKSLRATFTALFKDPVNAERAYKLALQKGYKKEDINILMSEETKKKITVPK
jgi:hypothetical protein